MSDFTIKLDMADIVMKRAIDSAVHAAIERFKDELGEDREIVADIAQAAAYNAVEQFMTWANSELRFIQVEYKRRVNETMLRPPAQFIPEEVSPNEPA